MTRYIKQIAYLIYCGDNMKTIFGIIAIIFGGLSLICLILLVALVKSNKGKTLDEVSNKIKVLIVLLGSCIIFVAVFGLVATVLY